MVTTGDNPTSTTAVMYRCACGQDVSLCPVQGANCCNCGRRISPTILNNVLAATMTISGPLAEVDPNRLAKTDESDQHSMIGRRFGHFEIIKPLGKGGSGYVYQALDTSLQRYVAVKLLRNGSGSADHEQDSETDVLMQEAVAQARVAHPNIVTIYYVGREESDPFLAMELIDGISLSERIQQGEISFAEISGVAEQITRALTFSYGMDIIHGDIKPSNILLPRNGDAKLSDFGMARRVSEKEKNVRGGTPNYLAPELLNGGTPSKQSDMYALGVTLYEMTFGRLPVALTGTTLSEWRNSHQHSEIEFPAVWPEDLPPNWRGFLKKLLARDPADRFESYDQLSRALSKLTPRSNVIAQPLPRIIATLIDWTTVMLLMMPFRVAVRTNIVESSTLWQLAVIAMDFLPIALYTIIVFFWRQSVGRRLMQLRVLNHFGMIPIGRKMALRSVLRMIVPWLMAIMMLFSFVRDSWWELIPGSIAFGLLVFMLADTAAMLFSKNRRSIHDRIFRTQVVIDSK